MAASILDQSGIGNLVLDSASIEVNRRKRRAKTDRLDVEKLLTMLIRYQYGEHRVWSVVRVPSPEEEDNRQLNRELRSLKKEKTRTTNRIKGLLASQGVRLEPGKELSDKKLDSIRLWDGSPFAGVERPPAARAGDVVFLKRQILSLEGDRRRELREGENPDLDQVRQLASLRGVGVNGGWVLVREFFAWREFNNRREVGSLAGLTPTPYQSGESRREQGISKAGNRHVRGVMIELAWSWVRFQPESSSLGGSRSVSAVRASASVGSES